MKLMAQIRSMARCRSRTSPLHWTDLVQRFVKELGYSNDELVAAVNSLLVPFGSMRGSNHNFWFED